MMDPTFQFLYSLQYSMVFEYPVCTAHHCTASGGCKCIILSAASLGYFKPCHSLSLSLTDTTHTNLLWCLGKLCGIKSDSYGESKYGDQ